MDITTDTHQVAELAALWKTAPELTQREMLRTATEINLLVQGELQQDLPRGAGGLHGAGLVGSIHGTVQGRADGVLGMVSTSQPYAEYVETGTKPHRPPMQPLEDWVHAVLGLSGDEEKGAAFAIASKIAKKGTTKQPVWQETYNRILPQIQVKVEAGLARVRAKLAEQPA